MNEKSEASSNFALHATLTCCKQSWQQLTPERETKNTGFWVDLQKIVCA